MSGWWFPLGLVLCMASASANFGTLVASVKTVQDLYPDQSSFMVNFVNFNYFWMFLIIGPFVPSLNRRIPRGVMLMSSSFLMLVGSVLQGVSGFEWLLLGSLISNLPQPILAASLADTLGEYIRPHHDALFMGLYVASQNIAFGIHYLLAVWYMETVAKFEQNLFKFVISWSVLAAASLFVSCIHLFWERADGWKPLIRNSNISPRRTPSPSDLQDRLSAPSIQDTSIFWMMMVSYAVQNAWGNVVALFFPEIVIARNLSQTDLTVTILLIGAFMIPLPVLVGVLLDAIESWRILPWCIVALQTVTQILLFYAVRTSVATIATVVAFSICNNALTTAFLPSLTHMPSNYDRAFVNATMAWLTTFCTAMGNLVAFAPPPIFSLLKLVSLIAGLSCTILPIFFFFA